MTKKIKNKESETVNNKTDYRVKAYPSNKKSQLVLAENQVFSFDTDETGLNNNVLVLGSTGTGKTVSVTEAQLLNTFTNSIVVTATKRKIVDEYKPLLKNRGYRTFEINLVDNKLSTVGFDPLGHIANHSDMYELAKTIVEVSSKADVNNESYWNNAATSLITAEIAAVFELWEDKFREDDSIDFPSMEEVLAFHAQLKFKDNHRSDFTTSTMDGIFEEFELRHPNSYAVSCWKAVQGLAAKTVSCVYSTVSTAYNTMFTPQAKLLMRKHCFHPMMLGDMKTALFIVTSPSDKGSQAFTNLIYADIFKQLCLYAETLPDYRLSVPVHLICDDFACGCKIPQFAEHISVFRAAGISATILLQSESQLIQIYGLQDAVTIVNNCDSIVYLGGSDITTCTNIAKRLNKSLYDVLYMPLKMVYVFRRGSAPVLTERYQTYEDKEYEKVQKLIEEKNKDRDCL